MRAKRLPLLLAFATTTVLLLASSCASSKKKTTPELDSLNGKKVALIEVKGEATAQSIVEVALVNQLLKNGTFILIGKREVNEARIAVGTQSNDWKDVAKKAGAEVALRAKVIDFEAEEKNGYSTELVDDSVMAAERGEAYRKTERLFKVKALEGKVRIELQFAELAKSDDSTAKATAADVRVADAVATDRAEASEQNGGAHLPPRLRFLEKLSNQAFEDFFKKYR